MLASGPTGYVFRPRITDAFSESTYNLLVTIQYAINLCQTVAVNLTLQATCASTTLIIIPSSSSSSSLSMSTSSSIGSQQTPTTSRGLSKSAQAGIGVGGSLAAISLLSLCAFFFVRSRAQRRLGRQSPSNLDEVTKPRQPDVVKPTSDKFTVLQGADDRNLQPVPTNSSTTPLQIPQPIYTADSTAITHCMSEHNDTRPVAAGTLTGTSSNTTAELRNLGQESLAELDPQAEVQPSELPEVTQDTTDDAEIACTRAKLARIQERRIRLLELQQLDEEEEKLTRTLETQLSGRS